MNSQEELSVDIQKIETNNDLDGFIFVDQEYAKSLFLCDFNEEESTTESVPLLEQIIQADILADISIPFFVIVTQDTFDIIKETIYQLDRMCYVISSVIKSKSTSNIKIVQDNDLEGALKKYNISLEDYNIRKMTNYSRNLESKTIRNFSLYHKRSLYSFSRKNRIDRDHLHSFLTRKRENTHKPRKAVTKWLMKEKLIKFGNSKTIFK